MNLIRRRQRSASGRGRAPGGLLSVALMGALALGTAACSPKWESATNDPFEPLNRAVFSFNLGFDEYFLRPVTVGYRALVPKSARNSVSNFLYNLREPLNALHAGLQGDEKGVETSIGRFVVNTSLGLGGLFDVARDAGLYRDPRGFGSTLASWGVGPGQYVVLPLLGPSNFRDAAGSVTDLLISPSELVVARHSGDPTAWEVGKGVVKAVSMRNQNFEAFDMILRHSLDPYISARSAYMQRSGDPLDDDPFFDLEFEDDDHYAPE